MSVVDTLLRAVAPVQCVACGAEGDILCSQCLEVAGEPMAARCAGCKKLSKDWKTCGACKSWLPLSSVQVVTAYEGLYERIVAALKFKVQRQAAETIAQMMHEATSQAVKSADVVLCPIPTASARIRERGFDHARLVTKHLSNKSGRVMKTLLARHTNVRQLGASRSQRMRQMEEEFHCPDTEAVRGRHVVLIDDVMTTGATLASAAKVLKKAGAKEVSAVIFTQKA